MRANPAMQYGDLTDRFQCFKRNGANGLFIMG